jgi:hypothetical protein
MIRPHWSDELAEMGACIPALRYARRFKTFKNAWKACTNDYYLMWLIRRRARSNVVIEACNYLYWTLPMCNVEVKRIVEPTGKGLNLRRIK